jgi:glycosyltransferase involved in cell wall biosynthesis
VNSSLRGGGTDEQVLLLSAGLTALGHEVILAAPEGAPLLLRSGNLPMSLQPMPRAKWSMVQSLIKTLREQRPHIIHAHHGRDYWPIILAAKASGVHPKIVITRHLAKSPASFASKYFLLSATDAVIAVSDFTAHVLSQGDDEPSSAEPERWSRPKLHGPSHKIHTILCGLNPEQFQPTLDLGLRRLWGFTSEHYLFAMIGSMDRPRGKGQLVFLEAAAQLLSVCPQARFLLVGRGTLEPEVRGFMRTAHLSDKVHLESQTTQVAAFLNGIDCLVHPAIGTEAYGLVVTEAMLCGRPVIASALDGIPEAFALGGYGQLVSPESIPQLVSAMESQLKAPKLTLTERLNLHLQVAAECHFWKMSEKTGQLYTDLLRVAS